MKKKFVAIIPARGGSKGVPDKNIRLLSGFPMIAYSILAAKLSKNISETIITTDSKKIASISKKFGADVPFLRPASISRDNSTDIEFVRHAIKWYEKNKSYIPDYWVILRPTTPLREPDLISNSIEKIKKNPEASSLVSVHEIPETPAKMFGMKGSYLHGLSPFDPRKEYYTLPRQEFPSAYSGNGYIDIIKTSTVVKDNMFYGDKILSFKTDYVDEIDIISDIKKLEQSLDLKNNKIRKYLEKNF